MNNKSTKKQKNNTFATIMQNALEEAQNNNTTQANPTNQQTITTLPHNENIIFQHTKREIMQLQNKQHQNVYVSVGDINGIGLELILRNHDTIAKHCTPIYCISESLLRKAAQMLDIAIPDNLQTHDIGLQDIIIKPGEITAESGYYSFMSFSKAVELSLSHNAALVTLPIHKYAWNLAGIEHIGHTQYLRYRFQKDAIMMLGCQELFVALYTDHIPLQDVPKKIQKESFLHFLQNFYYSFIVTQMPKQPTHKQSSKEQSTTKTSPSLQYADENILKIPMLDQIAQVNAIKQHALNAKMVKRLLHDPLSQQIVPLEIPHHLKSNVHAKDYNHASNNNLPEIAVLGLNPHAGDNGLLGKEDFIIQECIELVNAEIGKQIFIGPLAPDSAFIPSNRKKYKIFIAMYHDSGLTPLKALYFDKSINVSLNLPILRTSPDHGTCFDRAYKKNSHINMESYLESFKFIFRYWETTNNF